MKELLIIEDDRNARRGLVRAFEKAGYTVVQAATAQEALKALKEKRFDVVLSDIVLPDGDGLELLKTVKESAPDTVVVMMTAFGNVRRAVKAMKVGAYDFIEKPVDLEKLRLVVKRALSERSVREENVLLKSRLRDRYRFDNIIGTSPAIQKVFGMIEQVGPTRATVLLTGESGTGKELIANAIHYNSLRAKGPLVKVNCASLTQTLLESELFGHEKGSFTGAVSRRLGRFEIADKGTLFLDELSEIPRITQVKLLRVLQEHEFERVGGNETIKVDVRIITATNADLEKEVEEGRVREDLYYRLKVVTIHLPALRQRREDIPALVQHFLLKYTEENDKEISGVDPRAMEILIAHDWPGNVRQLQNCIEHAVVMTRDGRLKPEDLSVAPSEPAKTPGIAVSAGRQIKDMERDLIRETLRATGGNKTRAAKMLGIGARTLYRKLKEYGIEGL
jgi:DNA-binding NtrC family response regulator